MPKVVMKSDEGLDIGIATHYLSKKTSLDSIIARAIWHLHQHGWGNIEPRCHTLIVSSRDSGRTIGTRPVAEFYSENRRSQAPAQTHHPKHQYIQVAIHNNIIRIRQPGIRKDTNQASCTCGPASSRISKSYPSSTFLVESRRSGKLPGCSYCNTPPMRITISCTNALQA